MRDAEKKREYQKAWWERNKERKREYARQYRAKHRETIREAKRKWNASNPERHRFTNYRLRPAQIEEMRQVQGGRCAICPRMLDQSRRSGEHVDHCHKTGKVRGLLCHHCNNILGKANDDVEILRSAIAYLEKHALSSTNA